MIRSPLWVLEAQTTAFNQQNWTTGISDISRLSERAADMSRST
jgi:hypothetical protein